MSRQARAQKVATLLGGDPRLIRAAHVGAAGLLLAGTLLAWTTRAGHAAGHTVDVTGNSFQPETIDAAVGDAITWSNRDPETHSVVGGPINSPDIPPGATFTYTVSQAGDISYTCRFHPYMTGTIHVTSGGGAQAAPPTSPQTTAPPATSPPPTAAPGTTPTTSAPAVTTTTVAAAANGDELADPDEDPAADDDDPEAIDDEDVDENVDSVAEDDASEADPRAVSSTATTRASGSAVAATTSTSAPRAATPAFPADVAYVEPDAPVEEMTDNGPLTAVSTPPMVVAAPTTTTAAPTTTSAPGAATVEPDLSSTSATRKVGGAVALTAVLALVLFLLFGRPKRKSE